MKVLKNNYNLEEDTITPKSIQIKCDRCGSELEITVEDTYIGAYGAVYLICPCCNEETMVEELDGITLTKDNIKFPLHFVRTNKNMRCVKEIEPEEIEKEIKRGIEYFRINKEEWAYYMGYGDMSITIFRYDGDEEYHVLVAKDYYDTYIPFESQDYK